MRKNWHHKLREPAVFGVVGVISTGVYFCISLACLKLLNIPAIPSSVIGHTIATCVSYSGHHHFTFKKQSDHATYMKRFLVLTAINYLLNVTIVQIATRGLSLSATTSFIAVALIVPGISFLINKFWVFR